jgi:uroporphyrinogen decarboxylase
MTSRERILSALNHREPDRAPVDLSGHRSSGISAIAYARLREHLGLERKTIQVYDPIQQLAIVHEDVLQLFKVDTIELGRAFALEAKHWQDWTLPDGTPCQIPAWVKIERANGEWVIRSESGRITARMPEGCLYFEQAYYPFAEQDDLDNLPGAFAENMWFHVASPPGPLAAGPEGIKVLQEGARRLRQQNDRAIIGLFGGNLLETGQMLYRNDNFLLLLAADPERAHQFLDKLVAVHLANLERFLGAVGPFIDVILFGDDLGMQNGPQISPRMYREFFLPRHALMWKRAKVLAKVKVMLHCCGGVYELCPA